MADGMFVTASAFAIGGVLFGVALGYIWKRGSSETFEDQAICEIQRLFQGLLQHKSVMLKQEALLEDAERLLERFTALSAQMDEHSRIVEGLERGLLNETRLELETDIRTWRTRFDRRNEPGPIQHVKREG